LTGWGFVHILEELPFAAGLQLLQADDYTKGIHRPWSRNNASVDIDALATIEDTLAKYGKIQVRESEI
jgi:hypothetical protein